MIMETSSPVQRRKLAAKVIAVGGAGASIAAQMAPADCAEFGVVVLHTSERSLAACAAGEKLLLGSKLMRGLGTGGDPELGRAAGEEEFEQLRSLCKGVDLVFVVAGLGGGTGSGIAPTVARAARESGALVIGVAMLPFAFEGARRQRQAQYGLQQFKAAADCVLCLHNQKVTRVIDQQTRLIETFRITNELLIDGILGIWQMLGSRGLIQVDFADLCSIVRGRHTESSFATAIASGENRARDLLSQLMSSPFLDSGQALTDADALLVSIVGGPDLSMLEVTQVMEQINRQAENAQVIMGATIADEFSGRTRVTVIASRRSAPDLASSEGTAHPAAARPVETSAEAPALVDGEEPRRASSRFVPPPPELTDEKREQLMVQQPTRRGAKVGRRWRQAQLPLEIVSKGRFEKSQPTVHNGEDLDVPTYIRRGIALN